MPWLDDRIRAVFAWSRGSKAKQTLLGLSLFMLAFGVFALLWLKPLYDDLSFERRALAQVSAQTSGVNSAQLIEKRQRLAQLEMQVENASGQFWRKPSRMLSAITPHLHDVSLLSAASSDNDQRAQVSMTLSGTYVALLESFNALYRASSVFVVERVSIKPSDERLLMDVVMTPVPRQTSEADAQTVALSPWRPLHNRLFDLRATRSPFDRVHRSPVVDGSSACVLSQLRWLGQISTGSKRLAIVQCGKQWPQTLGVGQILKPLDATLVAIGQSQIELAVGRGKNQTTQVISKQQGR